MKTLRVNTRTGSVTEEEMKEDYRFFGNRGLVARAAMDEIPRTATRWGRITSSCLPRDCWQVPSSLRQDACRLAGKVL